MVRIVLMLLLLLSSPVMAANEIRALVEASSTGNYAVITNPANPAQAWDTDAEDWATYDRTDADQQIALGSAIAAGAADEWQYADLPTGLSTNASYSFDVYDASGELLSAGTTTATGVPDVNVATIEGDAAKTYIASRTLPTGDLSAIKAKTDYLPSAAAGSNGGLPTVDASNRVAGIQGTITTLDGLSIPSVADIWDADLSSASDPDSAAYKVGNIEYEVSLNTEAINSLNGAIALRPTVTQLNTALSPLATQALLNQVDNKVDTANTKLGDFGESSAAEEIAALEGAVGGLAPGTTQPRVNRPAGAAFAVDWSRRNDGTHQATKAIRLRPGTVKDIAVSVDVAPVFGALRVVTVGTPTVSGGSITATALGPRDDGDNREAMVALAGTATAGESRVLSIPITMESGEEDVVEVRIEVFKE